MKIRVGQQLRYVALKPLIGLSQSSIVRIVTSVRYDVGEIRQGSVGDVLCEIGLQRDQVEALVAGDDITEISEWIVTLQIRPRGGIVSEPNSGQTFQISLPCLAALPDSCGDVVNIEYLPGAVIGGDL